MTERFQFVSTQEIENAVANAVPENTRRSTTFALRVYDDWVAARNAAFPSNQYPEIRNLPEESVERFNKILSHFIFEIRRRDGQEYPPNTIHGIMCGILRFLRDSLHRPDLNFFDKDNHSLKYLRDSLDCRMKKLTEKGIGLQKNQAAPVEMEDEDLLWSSGAFSLSSSLGLLTATYFYLCKAFGLRSRDEHRRLTIDQFVFGNDSTGLYLKFLGKTSKTASGGLIHHDVPQKELKHYDSPSPLSTYKIVKRYINVLKECNITEGPLYRRPLMKLASNLRYAKIPVGVNSISKLMPDAAKKAGLSTKLTGHSGKVTCATALFRSNIDEQLIKGRTGHRSDAVRAYKRISPKQELETSVILDYKILPSSTKAFFKDQLNDDFSFNLNVVHDLI